MPRKNGANKFIFLGHFQKRLTAYFLIFLTYAFFLQVLPQMASFSAQKEAPAPTHTGTDASLIRTFYNTV